MEERNDSFLQIKEGVDDDDLVNVVIDGGGGKDDVIEVKIIMFLSIPVRSVLNVHSLVDLFSLPFPVVLLHRFKITPNYFEQL